MKREMVIIPVEGEIIFKEITVLPEYDELKAALKGGLLEIVPRFNSYKMKPCVAFCDEEGKLKQLPVNTRATAMWYVLVGINPDFLVGPIVIVAGEKEFLAEM